MFLGSGCSVLNEKNVTLIWFPVALISCQGVSALDHFLSESQKSFRRQINKHALKLETVSADSISSFICVIK